MRTNAEADRYRLAAEEALNQIEWCIRYLERIRKPQIADVVARNTATIRRRLRDADAAPPR